MGRVILGCMRFRMSTLIGITLFLAGCSTPAQPVVDTPIAQISSSPSSSATRIPYPIKDGAERITKKPFGILISPATSPVQPERFKGYHTGTDFEIFPGEEESDVEIFAICSGKIRFAGWVKGYGGVVIQDCLYKNEAVTVLYGHLNIDSVSMASGADLTEGAKIGNLGKGFSKETDGERKHLHLAIHRGSKLEYRGYVQKEEELREWIDPFQTQ